MHPRSAELFIWVHAVSFNTQCSGYQQSDHLEHLTHVNLWAPHGGLAGPRLRRTTFATWQILMCILRQTQRKESCVWLQEARVLKRAWTDQITMLQYCFKYWTQYCPYKGNYSFKLFNWACLATFQMTERFFLVKKTLILSHAYLMSKF